jgi:hypothetical protein
VNPRVSLHLNSDREGGQVATFEGSARICEGHPPGHEVDAYLAKYREGIAGTGMTPEQMGAEYSTALRITPGAGLRLLTASTRRARLQTHQMAAIAGLGVLHTRRCPALAAARHREFCGGCRHPIVPSYCSSAGGPIARSIDTRWPRQDW